MKTRCCQHRTMMRIGMSVRPVGLLRPPSSFLRQPFTTMTEARIERPPPHVPAGQRRVATKVGDDKSGHISAGVNEGIFFMDNIYPLKLRWLMRFNFLNIERSFPELLKKVKGPRAASLDPMGIIQRSLPKRLPISINEIIPRIKEGGSFVKFSHDPHISGTEIEGTVRSYLKENPVRPFFNPWRRVRAFLVKGKPWVEDLQRFPSPIVKVEFLPAASGEAAVELTQETVYSLFRKYGKIADIKSQPTDSKVLPKYANVAFRATRNAVMAKNCLHGIIVPEAIGGGKAGTIIKIGYEPIIKAHWIRDWLANHPRVVFPILLALLAGITVTVFDPIRTFFIKAHVLRHFHLAENKAYKWVVSQISRVNIFRPTREEPGLRTIYEDRKPDIEQIQTWLLESADTFIVVQGPRGSGKKELVCGEVLKERQAKLVIDCKPIQEARGDSSTINATAEQVGYKPVFSWMNSVSSLIDLAAQGTIGTKTGFSETLDTQLQKILQNTTTALKEIGLSGRKKEDKDRELGEDEYLEAHPEQRPVVVIDNFLHKSQESSVVYDKLSEWAANLTTSNVAHVIFLTTDVSFSKALSRALPDRVFRTVCLADCSPEIAKRFVLDHIGGDGGDGAARPDLHDLDGCIATLGGRLSDLAVLARRMASGEAARRAVAEMVEQTAAEILKMYVLDGEHGARGWTAQQAWQLVTLLAGSGQVRYHAVLLSDTFRAGEAALLALERAELVAVARANGRPVAVRPGRPVYRAAFQFLAQDRVLKASLDRAVLAELIAVETGSIERCERELELLGGLPSRPQELRPRIAWLLRKVSASQGAIDGFEAESAALKKILREEY